MSISKCSKVPLIHFKMRIPFKIVTKVVEQDLNLSLNIFYGFKQITCIIFYICPMFYNGCLNERQKGDKAVSARIYGEIVQRKMFKE